jgi:hypothetical protein
LHVVQDIADLDIIYVQLYLGTPRFVGSDNLSAATPSYDRHGVSDCAFRGPGRAVWCSSFAGERVRVFISTSALETQPSNVWAALGWPGLILRS